MLNFKFNVFVFFLLRKARQSSADRNNRAEYYDTDGAWAEYETRPTSVSETGATRDRVPSSRPPLPKC
jgi:hypothetical protein